MSIDQLFLPSENIQARTHMENKCEWTDTNKMKLNEKKSKFMELILLIIINLQQEFI